MKILFAGSGTGGHFYPLIAVAEELRRIAKEERLIEPQLYFAGPSPYDKDALIENEITFLKVPAGKLRRYISIHNILDAWKTAVGICWGLVTVFRIFPDVVFSKGGYTSVPIVFAARFFGIPVVIHESDSRPGRANLWAAKFAKRIAISYPTAAQFFPPEKTALTGNPTRKEIREPQKAGARQYLKLEEGTPVILILGGSQGAKRINETILDMLPEMIQEYEIIHQTGTAHIDDIRKTAGVILEKNPLAGRYHPFAYLAPLSMKMSAGVASLVISRAGSTIFEIAQWGIPSIILPLTQDVSHDQLHNAITYAKSGACLVVEDANLTPHVLLEAIRRILGSEAERTAMSEAAKEFGKRDAATIIARELISMGLKHDGISVKSTPTPETREKTNTSAGDVVEENTASVSGISGQETIGTTPDSIPSNITASPSGTKKARDEFVHPFSIGPH